jgi:two-component system sensor kinase FixL
MPDDPRFIPAADPAHVLRAILDSSESAIVGIDLNGIIVGCNGGAGRLYGHAATEMIGHSLSILMPPGADDLAKILDSIRSGRSVAPREAVRTAKDGRMLTLRASAAPVRDANGALVGGVEIGRDITERVRMDLAALTTEARWRTVIDAAVDGIIVIDERGLIDVFNPAAERMFGYSAEEMRGRNVSVLMPSPYQAEHDAYMHRYLRTGHRKIIGIGREVTGLRRDGTTFPMQLSVGEMRAGGARHFIGILHDLSERVRLEERVRGQEALARLGEMGAVIAHEVKNPLAAMRGAIEVISGRMPAGSKEAPILKEIITRIDALNGLLRDLLLFARAPQPHYGPVALGMLLTSTADLLARDPALSELHITVTGNPPPVQGDPELLRIVFQNLLINAAQAMHSRGTIQATITAAEGTQQVDIADTGPGIPPEERDKVFRPFFTTKARGTGLGLATAKRFIELHSGTITISCPPAGGTVVTIKLPSERPQNPG